MLKTTVVWGALTLVGQFAPALVWSDEPPQNVEVEAVFVQEEPRLAITQAAPENAARLVDVGSGTVLLGVVEPSSKFWIGLGCEQATDALKSQLGLAEKPAILVTMVADNSPAKTAGLQVHDVLTTVKLGEETAPLDGVATLTNFVTKAEQKSITLSVVRQGKSLEISVTPAERPQPKEDVLIRDATAFNLYTSPPATAANAERVQLLLRELQAAVAVQTHPTTIHFTGPVVAPSVPALPPPSGVPHIVVMSKPELPENVTITISKTGKDPVRIKYQQGEGKSWGATETEINTLPQEGRAALHAVLTALHQGLPHSVALGAAFPGAGGMRSMYKTEMMKGQGLNSKAGVTGVIATKVAAPPKSSPKDAERLQALEKQMEQLQKQQQELMTKQQESLRKELQSLRETLEKIEKK
ncbi:MAG: PDZ domain-containing protein [Planctomycetaceae bacterium]|nr:PDZ domain-containing protein [Planctomycetaceae bacterium]